MTRTGFAQAERIADAAEGFRHRRRQGVDLQRVVAKLLGADPADRELLLLIGRVGNVGEALLHGGTDFIGVLGHGTVLVGSFSPPVSF
jgi:hypothetical protein